MLHLQRLEHSYLHELFKAVLLYDDAQKVQKILARKIGGKLMKEWKIDRTYQELAPAREWEKYKGNVDVLWTLTHPNTDICGRRIVAHEIKTGHYVVETIIKKYRNLHYSSGGHNAGDVRPTTTNTPLFIWGWVKYHKNASDEEKTRPKVLNEWFGDDPRNEELIRRGAVRLLPLDWLLPILEERMSEIFEWTN